jgi:hypothetical protein
MQILWLSQVQCKLKILCLMWKCINFPCFFLAKQILIEYKSLVVYSTPLYIKSLHSLIDSKIEGEVPFPRNQEHRHNYLPLILASNKSLTYFLAQSNILKNYCHGKNIRANNLFIMPLLDETLLEQQTIFYTITTMSNVIIVMKLSIYYYSC